MYVQRRYSVGVLSRLQLPFYGVTKGSSVVHNLQLARKGRRGVLTGGNVLARIPALWRHPHEGTL